MRMPKLKSKIVETIKVRVIVTATDIAEGLCLLISKCMEKIAIERALRKLDPRGGDHRVRIDGVQIRFNLDGHKWHALLPRPQKRMVIQFDHERKARERAKKRGEAFVSKVQPHRWIMEATKGDKIQPFTRERQEQVNAARRRRIAEGRPDKTHYDLRHRVEGMGAV